jgi:hypothetical protein
MVVASLARYLCDSATVVRWPPSGVDLVSWCGLVWPLALRPAGLTAMPIPSICCAISRSVIVWGLRRILMPLIGFPDGQRRGVDHHAWRHLTRLEHRQNLRGLGRQRR